MNEGKMVSVIIPVYNVAPYLERCLDSVTGSSYRNLEIFCINDGSTDESPAILEAWARKDARIRVISRENRGLAATRNEALAMVRGEYVTYVDSDDWIHPQMIERMVTAAEENDVSVVICGKREADAGSMDLEALYEEERESSGSAGKLTQSEVKSNTEARNHSKTRGNIETGNHLATEISSSCKVCNVSDFFSLGTIRYYFWGKLYRRELLAGRYFDSALEPSEDRAFNALLFAEHPEMAFAYLDQPLYTYVRRVGSILATRSRVENLTTVVYMAEQAAHLGKYGDRVLADAIKLFLSSRLCVQGEEGAEEKLAEFHRIRPILERALKESVPAMPDLERDKWLLLLRRPEIYTYMRKLLEWRK